MREIKFRIWDEEEHKMERALAVDWFFKTAITSANPATNSHPRGVSFRDKDEILMQYTGLQDRNGREIYEGDIIKYDDAGGEAHTQVVRYDDEMGAFGCNRGALMDHFNCMWEIEVIGNIYENPELFKDKE